MEEAPQQDRDSSSDEADLVTLLEWLQHLSEVQRTQLTESEDALRRLERMIALLDGSAVPGDALHDVRSLIAAGVARVRLPQREDNPPIPPQLITTVATEALWPLVEAKRWHDGWLGAIRQVMSPEVATLVSTERAVKTNRKPRHVKMELAQSLADARYAAGILNLLEDLCDEGGGWPAFADVYELRDGSRPSKPRDVPALLVKIATKVGDMALAGIIGALAYDLTKQAWNQLIEQVQQRSTSTGATGSAPAPPRDAKPIDRLSRADRLGERLIIEQPTHLELVRVSAGEFLMGSNPRKDKDAGESEQPQHWVYLDEYYIGRYPITVAQFAVFVRATGHKTTAERENSDWMWRSPRGPGSDVAGKAEHPITYVSWNDAVEFCQWLSRAIGRKFGLPTEAQWEKAARWDAHKREARVWTWGNIFDKSKANTLEGGVLDTTPVGSYSQKGGDSPYGCADMAGNVWEWCADWFDGKEYEQRAKVDRVVRNPRGPANGSARVLRGGSFIYLEDLARCAYRHGNPPSSHLDYYGFRVCALRI